MLRAFFWSCEAGRGSDHSGPVPRGSVWWYPWQRAGGGLPAATELKEETEGQHGRSGYYGNSDDEPARCAAVCTVHGDGPQPLLHTRETAVRHTHTQI